MGHSHTHHHGDSGNIRTAFLLNLGFTLLELVGGAAINSVAILSDALHDLGDSIALGLAWFLSSYAERASDRQYSYGYRRFSLLGGFINAVVLIVGSQVVLSEAIPRLASPEPFDERGMIVFAVIGVAVNGFAAWRLRGESSANAQVVGWHLIEDVLGWVAVLVVGIISLFADLPILDPILSILITLYVLWNVIRRLKSVAELFLQAVPREVDIDDVARRLEAVDGVEKTHDVHVWSLDGEHNVLTAHLEVAPDTSRDAVIRIKQAAKRALAEQHLNLEHVTLEIEFQGIDCSMSQQAEAAHDHAHE
jgi:cobalt-zinc-cadmium efflux system protein